MARQFRQHRTLLAVTIGLIVACGGCSHLRLPAIDPSGQRIFLPAPNSTALAPHHNIGLPRPPQPAFVAPPVPPDCPLPVTAPSPLATAQAQTCGQKKSTHKSLGDCLHPERRAQIVMMPKRVVAPVGGEVILMSGLCGAHGHRVKGEQLEWMLSQESVGNFLQVGRPGQDMLASLRSTTAELKSANYARSATSRTTRLITRGTQSPADDVTLEPGQSWVTLTSPSEGVSHVTVVATNSEVWDQRRETATIYWVDARWELPPPAALRAGQSHLLQTRVLRDSAGTPAANWIVRYELAAGTTARFLPGGQQVAETVVDASGLASVEIQPGTRATEAAHVRVQIIRPLDPGDGVPRMTVGQGWTSVTWSAPGLNVRAAGPATTRAGETLTYQVQVTNSGNLVTRGVTLKDEPPAGLVVLGSNPPPQQFGDRHHWPLGDLGPGETRTITVQARLELDRTVRYIFRAESVDGLSADAFVETSVERPTLAVEVTGPQRAQVGERATYEVHVRNTSGRDLANVVVTDTYDPGLEQTEGAPSPIRRQLGPIRADEVKSFAVSFIVRQPGTWCHTLEATAPDGYTARTRACLQADPPQVVAQPAIDVQLSGPAEQTVGGLILLTAQITNTGNVPLNQIQIAMSFDPALAARQASENYRLEQGQFVWFVEQLQPQQSLLRQLNLEGVAPAAAAGCRVAVWAAGNVQDSDAIQVRIVPAPQPRTPQPPNIIGAAPPSGAPPRPADGIPAAPPANLGGRPAVEPPAAATAGQLALSIADAEDPIVLGDVTTYLIQIANQRDVEDRNVLLTIRLSDGLRFERIEGPIQVRASADQGRTIEMVPINSLRPREQMAPLRLFVRGTAIGEMAVQAEVTSQRSPAGVRQQETTTVVAAQP